MLDDLVDNNDGAAVKTLEAFISRVEAERGDTINEIEALVLIAAGVIACVLPARRAASVDPAVALRAQ